MKKILILLTLLVPFAVIADEAITINGVNEPEWKDLNGNTTDKIPIELNQSLVPNDIKNATGDPSVLINEKRGYTKWGYSTKMSEVKPKDKWIKIRIRYNGERLAVITAIKTLYSISYS